MGLCDGQWTPVIMMVSINAASGLSNALVKKALDSGIDHMIIATYRLLISTLFLAPIAYFWERKTRPKLTLSILVQLFCSALLGASLTQYFFLLGLSYTSATIGCAFLGIIPAITFIMALMLRQEKLNLRSKSGYAMAFGTLVCISGGLFLAFYKGVPLTNFHSQPNAAVSQNSLRHKNWVLGCALLLAGDIFFASWLMVHGKINRKYPCHYSSTVILSIFGTIQCALLSLINVRDIAGWIVKDKLDIIIIVYAGAVAQGICTVGITWCIRKRGPVFTSVFNPLTLIFATIFDFSILRRQIYLGSVLGSAVVIFGLYVFLWGKTRDTKERAEKLPTEMEKQNEQDFNKTSHPVVVPMTP